jgi:hypothetical protein
MALKKPGNLLKPDGESQLQIDRNLWSSSFGLYGTWQLTP